jgi:hypothetical protein
MREPPYLIDFRFWILDCGFKVIGQFNLVLYTKVRIRCLSILFHPHPASPVKGEGFSFPPQAASGS